MDPNYDLIVSRLAMLAGFGLDAKRTTAWAQYGYTDEPTFAHYLQAYERGGAGHGAVHRLLDKCWQERPRIKKKASDKETPWETKTAELFASITAWPKLRDFDRRNMVGRYAGLIYRVADGKALTEPLTTGGRPVDIVPVYEDQLRVERWDEDTSSETFAQPVMWQYRMRSIAATGDQQGRPSNWVSVHPSRVQILAEGAAGGDFLDGVPLLKAGFNNLVDLEKIHGGAAEGFLKNSARTLVLQFDANGSPQALASTPGQPVPAPADVKTAIEAKVRDLNRNIDSSIVLQGGEASTLKTEMADPSKPFEVVANLFAASVQIPFTILFGQQTGRLASDQDQKDWIARCQGRQANELTPMLEQLVKRWQAAGWIDAGDFEIEWPPLDAPGDDAKAELALKLTKAMEQFFDAGGTEPLLDRDEVRRVVGFEQKPADDELREGEPPVDVAARGSGGKGGGGSAPPALRAA